MSTNESVTPETLLAGLRDPTAYPDVQQEDEITVHETHISWLFLVGAFVFKIKKPIATDFLDYRTLAERKRLCEEEVRLDRRYAPDLYLGVVPISVFDGKLQIERDDEPVEYAVKMRRFPADALLSQRLQAGKVEFSEVQQLAGRIADFHRQASQLDLSLPWGSPQKILADAVDNVRALRSGSGGDLHATLDPIEAWTSEFCSRHEHEFSQRREQGFIRECHGDLHLGNVVYWNGQLIPFDGIEFNEAFRWIDVLSDAAFLAMDFAAHHRFDLGHEFINAYLEQTGDYESLALLRFYGVYRALVRAKVASIRVQQSGLSQDERTETTEDRDQHIALAQRLMQQDSPRLWITHGVSGSGKTTISQQVVRRLGAIRVRSDIERKRHFGMPPANRPDETKTEQLYSESATRATYERLRRLARGILQAGYSVIVDATFLNQQDRQRFADLADEEGVPLAIVDCRADEATLRQRIVDRGQRDHDASDADLSVLEKQLASQDPLTEWERSRVVDPPR